MAFDLESFYGEPAVLDALSFYQYDLYKEQDDLSRLLVDPLLDEGSLHGGLQLEDDFGWVDLAPYGAAQQPVQPCLQVAVVEPLEADGVQSPSSSCDSPVTSLLDEPDLEQDLLMEILGSVSMESSFNDDTNSTESLSPEQSIASSPPMSPMKRGRGSKPQKRSVRYSELKGVRKEKKREQNKTAAERYRMKKKTEKETVFTHVEVLENRNKELRDQVESAEFELKSMKDLLSQVYGMDVEAAIRTKLLYS